MKKINVAIIGTSGYTASELIRLIHSHPQIEIKHLVGNSTIGKKIEDIYPHTKFTNLPKIQNLKAINFKNIQLVFCCLPHGESSSIISKIPKEIKIIDLAADFRIKKAPLYKKYYQQKLPTLINEAAYGLTELNKDNIKKKRITACPGCYPTSILLPLKPLIDKKLIDKTSITIDSKTGISGAGRKSNTQFLFCEVNENVIPYNINQHRHLAELFEQLDLPTNSVQFTPQLIPISRGIISTIYINSTSSTKKIRDSLQKFYKHSHFIKITGSIPNIRNVTATNYCEIGVLESNIKNQHIIISVIDNLTKGSSGQAIQNFNLIFDLPDNTGLDNLAIYP
jgi:N-acetyl-gamma-glutamyl-phosphate reductase